MASIKTRRELWVNSKYPDASKRQPGAVRLHDATRTGKRQTTRMIVAGALNTGAWGFLLTVGAQDDGAMFFGLVAVGVAFLLTLWLMWDIFAGMKIGLANVEISNEMPFLGEEIHLRYAQRIKKHCTVSSVTITLLCTERASYTVGTNRYTVTENVVNDRRELVDGGPARPGDILQGECSLVVPGNCMHSFHAGNSNDVSWRIELRVGIESWPDYFAKFELHVPPVRLPGTVSSMTEFEATSADDAA